MDRKEAADLLDNLIGMVEDSHGADYDTALRMGVEALSAQPDHSGDVNGKVDPIDRRAAIEAIRTKYCSSDFMDDGVIDAFAEIIQDLPSAQPEQKWIPCSERLPEDLEEVNVTWVNHDPEPYYDFTKDKPATASAVYYKEKWYWYSSVCTDLLAEYGENEVDKMDDAIEVIAWMPLPEPWRGEEHEL